MTFTASELSLQGVLATAHVRSIDAQIARERARAVAMSLGSERIVATNPADVVGCACSFDMRRSAVHDGAKWSVVGDEIDSGRAFRASALGNGPLYASGDMAQWNLANSRTLVSTVNGDAMIGTGDFLLLILGSTRSNINTFILADTNENLQVGIDSGGNLYARVGSYSLIAGKVIDVDDAPMLIEVELLGDVLTFRAGLLGVASTSGVTHAPIGNLYLGLDPNSGGQWEGLLVQLSGFAYVPDRETLRAMRADAMNLVGEAGIAEW